METALRALKVRVAIAFLPGLRPSLLEMALRAWQIFGNCDY
jgi:hypothetical protein